VGELIDSEAYAALHSALRSMPERYRDVVILCELEERSYEEVARLIGRPVGTVRSRLHRGRALLAGIMKRRNSDSLVGSAIR
jgi:RNA polymerase sigma-70 factor (ECF subfamily)